MWPMGLLFLKGIVIADIFCSFYRSSEAGEESCRPSPGGNGSTDPCTQTLDRVAGSVVLRVSSTVCPTRETTFKCHITRKRSTKNTIKAFNLLRVAVLDSFVQDSWR